MKVLSVQLDSVWQDSAQNLLRLREYLQQVEPGQVDVVVLPELFHCGFSMQVDRVSQTRQGRVYKALSDLARQYGVYIMAGFAERVSSNQARNCALVFDRNGNEQACYVKNRAFQFAGEGEHYQAGNQSVLFEVDGVVCSVFICYDLRFPELFRQVVPQAEMVFVIANWPESRQSHWETLLRARAIENQCFVVGVNRIGEDGNGLIYVGGSMVIDPLGEILSYADSEQACQITEVSIKQVKLVRRQYPFLADIES